MSSHRADRILVPIAQTPDPIPQSPSPSPPVLSCEPVDPAAPRSRARRAERQFTLGTLLGMMATIALKILLNLFDGPDLFACLLMSPLALLWAWFTFDVGVRMRRGRVGPAGTVSGQAAGLVGLSYGLIGLVPAPHPAIAVVMLLLVVAGPFFAALVVVRRAHQG